MKHHVTAMYIRLSLEDKDLFENKKDESNSVKNQRDLIQRYITNSLDLYDSETIEFCDEGYTGTSLNRPALQAMLAKVNEGKVNCIIVKDFSRFARDHIEIGHYVEQYFPCMGIRFISVNDGYDSVDYIGMTPDMSFSFVTLLHEMYSSDLSQKIRSARKTRARMGKYLSPYAPYGYKKSAMDKNRLEVDEAAAEIVKRIFQMRLEGKLVKEIAHTLNNEGIPTPGQHKVMNGSKKRWQPLTDRVFWDASNIGVILRDERYIGNCVFGKRERYELGHAKAKYLPKSEWVIVEDTHEPIVSKDDFNKIQSKIKQQKKRKQPVKTNSFLAGRIRCGDCSHKLEVHGGKKPFFVCGTPQVHSGCDCFIGQFNAEETEAVILRLLQLKIEELISFGAHPTNQKQKLCRRDSLSDKKSLEEQIKRHKFVRFEWYELLREGKVSEHDYKEKSKALNQNIGILTEQIEAIKKLGNNGPVISGSDLRTIDNAKKYQYIPELTKEAVETFIHCIYVYDYDRIEVVWSFKDV